MGENVDLMEEINLAPFSWGLQPQYISDVMELNDST